jgi:hypothetical protein
MLAQHFNTFRVWPKADALTAPTAMRSGTGSLNANALVPKGTGKGELPAEVVALQLLALHKG